MPEALPVRIDPRPSAADLAAIDQGLGAFNDAAAPLHEVERVALAARAATGALLGGALGRCWGPSAELQVLWVDEGHRRQGIGERLLAAFEAAVRERGCRSLHLETFSFQALAFYAARGFDVAWRRDDFPHGIVKLHLCKPLR